MTHTEREVAALVTPLIEPIGLHLYDVEHQGGTLRVLVDAEGGADMDQITRATRAISAALDDESSLQDRYTLEVSSPGLERPLRRPEHWVAAVGATVTVKRVAGVEGDRRINGELVAVDDEAVSVRQADVAEDAAPLRIPFDEIDKARTVFAWEPAPKPGGARRTQSTSTKHKRVTTS